MTDDGITVLCFGDSNTWGFEPGTGERYGRETRWPGVMRVALGPRYVVIEEGLNGRTTVWDDPEMEGRNGRNYLVPCLGTHHPLDLVILFLGLNDLKKRFAATAEEIAAGAGSLVQAIQSGGWGRGGGAPKVLMTAPPLLGKLAGYAEAFEGAEESSRRLAGCLREVAFRERCEFLDSSALVTTSGRDGLHLEPEAHGVLGRALAARVREMFGE